MRSRTVLTTITITITIAVGGCGGSSSTTDGPPGSGGSHDLGSCTVFPSATGSRDDYSYWNLDISGAPVDPSSDSFISSMGASNVHPDFGSDPGNGIPFVTVPGSQPKVAMSFTGAADESEPGPYPYPPDAPIEGNSDAHVLVVDRDHCVVYETGNSVHHESTNTWSAYSGAVFDLRAGALRPEKWTS